MLNIKSLLSSIKNTRISISHKNQETIKEIDVQEEKLRQEFIEAKQNLRYYQEINKIKREKELAEKRWNERLNKINKLS